ncbi:MAG: hypothetical protein ABIH99_01140 [Candidatus Micrarchaeota archaeon]
MVFKRGQAAMEYLMTYGWAILVIIIVLAGLMYLGVFNIGERLPERCDFPQGFQCTNQIVTGSTGALTFNLINAQQKKVTLSGAICTSNDAAQPTTFEAETAVIPVGGNATVILNGAGICATGTQGAMLNGKIWVQYKLEGDAQNRVTSGSLYTKYQ